MTRHRVFRQNESFYLVKLSQNIYKFIRRERMTLTERVNPPSIGFRRCHTLPKSHYTVSSAGRYIVAVFLKFNMVVVNRIRTLIHKTSKIRVCVKSLSHRICH